MKWIFALAIVAGGVASSWWMISNSPEVETPMQEVEASIYWADVVKTEIPEDGVLRGIASSGISFRNARAAAGNGRLAELRAAFNIPDLSNAVCIDWEKIRLDSAAVLAFSKASSVRCLMLGPIDESEELAWLQACRKIEILFIRNSTVGDTALSNIGKLERLKWLAFSGCTIPRGSLSELSNCRELRRLGLRLSGDLSSHDKHVMEIPDSLTLDYVDLGGTSVTDAAIAWLAQHQPELTDLDLYRCTATSPRVFDSIEKFEKLTLLGLGLSGAVPSPRGNSAVERFRETNPNCHVDIAD